MDLHIEQELRHTLSREEVKMVLGSAAEVAMEVTHPPWPTSSPLKTIWSAILSHKNLSTNNYIKFEKNQKRRLLYKSKEFISQTYLVGSCRCFLKCLECRSSYKHKKKSTRSTYNKKYRKRSSRHKYQISIFWNTTNLRLMWQPNATFTESFNGRPVLGLVVGMPKLAGECMRHTMGEVATQLRLLSDRALSCVCCVDDF